MAIESSTCFNSKPRGTQDVELVGLWVSSGVLKPNELGRGDDGDGNADFDSFCAASYMMDKNGVSKSMAVPSSLATVRPSQGVPYCQTNRYVLLHLL